MLSIEEITDDSRELNIGEVSEYILAIPKFADKIGTENLRVLMNKLDDPQDKVRSVHVAGTNGKGSTTEMLRLMLTESGFRTGSFTSPHLVRMNERIAVDGVMISDEDFVSCFRKVMKAVEAYSLRHPSFFEFIFAMAAVYYEEQDVDYVVYETGMGGRLDATNIITPVVSVITSIGMDHMQYLGDTVEKIAYEKAGIIKPGVPVVHNAINNSDRNLKERAAEVIKNRAAELEAELTVVDSIDERLIRWIDLSELENPAFLTGYQRDNASTAIRAFQIIREHIADSVSEDINKVILRALNKFMMPARMEKLRKNVIIDGAHNTDAMPQFLDAAAEMIKREKPERVYFIFAVSNDKDYRGMVRMINDAALFDEIFITTFNSYRKTDVDIIKNLFDEYSGKAGTKKADDTAGEFRPVVRTIPEVKKCLAKVLSKLGDRELLFTAGSLYLAGEIEEILGFEE
ncbi:MAG: bifunctional folylpolyglutamate synthase/dihydrofolate synthase [Eubacterium sp.]|nr:bifunctional folylpolyglutamate synthase/dihydrofolate synthase [Eubacterium sp.]